MSNLFCRHSVPPPALYVLAFFLGSTLQEEVRLGAKLVKHVTISPPGESLEVCGFSLLPCAPKQGNVHTEKEPV